YRPWGAGSEGIFAKPGTFGDGPRPGPRPPRTSRGTVSRRPRSLGAGPALPVSVMPPAALAVAGVADQVEERHGRHHAAAHRRTLEQEVRPPTGRAVGGHPLSMR